ncbi:hypothetical protein ACGFOU_28580 [Streptomyces sp. NPDC048595]|uniref:hypothetical protein n=1 Tax=Streptomyces sp. NPDC048595 TaxID=3365576 RepID=UPI00371C36BB
MTNINTSDEFPYEGRCAKALKELKECPQLDVSEANFGSITEPLDDADDIFESLAEWHELPLDSEVRKNFFRFNEIEAYWCSSHPDSEMIGEFSLTHLYGSVEEKHMDDIWEGNDDWERELYGELRIFDDTPRSGTGRMATLRATPGTTNPEIWFFDMRAGAMEMDLDYRTYLDTLLITKGAIGWQYLFCDEGYGHPGFTPLADGLKEMLDTFPRLFPDYDYSELQARLRERM